MKKLILILILAAATLYASDAFAQATPPIDSSKISITLKAKHHAFIVAFMPERGGVDQVKYLSQLATKITLNDSGHIADTAQLITVTVTTDLVEKLFLAIGSQQERLTTTINDEIKTALLPQLFTRPQLLQHIIAITQQNSKETDELVQYGFHFITELKLY